MSTTVKIHNVWASFPHLFGAKRAPKGTPADKVAERASYNITLIADPDHPDLKAVAAAARAEAIETFGPEKGPKFPSPFKDGDEINQGRERKAKDPIKEYAGRMVLSAKNKTAVRLFGPTGAQALNISTKDQDRAFLAELQTQLTAGCLVNAAVEVYGFNHAENPGVYCTLKAVQLIESGTERCLALGGGGDTPAAEDTFGALPGSENAFDM